MVLWLLWCCCGCYGFVVVAVVLCFFRWVCFYCCDVEVAGVLKRFFVVFVMLFWC